jgi:hypothetical protein
MKGATHTSSKLMEDGEPRLNVTKCGRELYSNNRVWT